MNRVLWTNGCLVGLLAMLPVLYGCQKSASTGSAAKSAGGTANSPAEQEVSEIEDQLRSALYQLQPEHLNIDARLDDATSVLNNWWAAVKAAKLLPTGSQPAEIPTERVSAETLADLQRETFTSDDGRYIRDCYLARRVSDHVAAEVGSESQRATAVFQWVCRNMGLRRADEIDYAVGTYEALVIGRGTPADRASAVAAILQQLRIDSVIVTRASETSSAAPWLLGVIVQGEVLLFDPHLGLPVPRGDVPLKEAFSQPATLNEIQAHPEWLALLATRADRPYPLTADDLKAPKIEAISRVQAWSPRIWNLEQLLPGDTLCVLYDAPADTDPLAGVFARIAVAVPAVEDNDIGLWKYPEEREAEMRQPNQLAQRAMQEALIPFLVPVEFEQDKETGKQRRVETMRQLRIRNSQLFGLRGDALAQYITIRQLSVMPPPEPAFGPVYQRAADDAFFWSCVCKFENGDYESAQKVLSDYLKRYRRGGHWTFEARLLLAEALAASGDTTQAVQTLRVQESDDPYRAHHAIRIRSWSPPAETPPPESD